VDLAISVDDIDALLPQTQCTRCGYAGCRPYAQAIIAGEADINRCPPGGLATLQTLARRLNRPTPPPDLACGDFNADKVAWIDPSRCIGCARCLPPCPVDAIIGASRQLHVVLDAECTGCELCIAPCPVDCISLIDRKDPRFTEQAPYPEQNLVRYHAHLHRQEERQERRRRLLTERKNRVAARPL
jgi:electron transport complex protein RnfB